MNRVSSIFSYMLKLVSATPFERAPRLRLPKRMLSLDSNVFGLCAKVFDWAKIPQDQRHRESASAARSRGLAAAFRGRHRGESL